MGKALTPETTVLHSSLPRSEDISDHDLIPTVATAKTELERAKPPVYPFIINHNNLSGCLISQTSTSIAFYGESAAGRLKKFIDSQLSKDPSFRSHMITYAVSALQQYINPPLNLKSDARKASTNKR